MNWNKEIKCEYYPLTSPLLKNAPEKSDYLRDPFQFLPEEKPISNEEALWLKEKEKGKLWSGDDFVKMSVLRARERYDKESHGEIKNQLKQIIEQAKSMNLSLPRRFIEFVSNRDYLNRIRDDSVYCDLRSGIGEFREDNQFYVLTFWVDCQDVTRWSLLLDKKGNHCVVFNHFPFWDTSPKHIHKNDPPYETIICADSIEAFIIWLSIKGREADENQKKLLN